MANTKDYREKKAACYEKYRQGETDEKKLSVIFGVSALTVKKWITSGNWKQEADEIAELERKINENMMKALNAGLEQYTKDPQNSSLQSLVQLIKDYIKRTQPTKELNEYIIKFLEQSVDYFIGKGLEDLRVMFQEQLVELADYLRVKNNG